MRLLFLAALALMMCQGHMLAQQGGNAVYGQGYNQSIGKTTGTGQRYLTDTTFLIEGSVLMNIIADDYVVTFGVEEEASTIKECNEKIDKRINGFTTALEKLGLKQSDIYVDMTTQHK